MSSAEASTLVAAPPGMPTSKLAWPLLIAITFLTTIGMTIVFPVLPFILREYVTEASLALWVGVLESVYALCAFIAAPFLGSFSDRFGRKPILVISVLGSAAGYVMFGIGGALWCSWSPASSTGSLPATCR